MAVLTGVRDRLRAEMGAEPGTWGVVERVLEVVQERLVALGLETPSTSGPGGRPSVARGSGSQARAAEPNGAEPNGAEPGAAERNGAERNGAEPNGAEPNGAEPNGAEPGAAERNGAERNGAERNGAEPNGAEPGGAEGDAFAAASSAAGSSSGESVFRTELVAALDRRGLPPDTSLADLLDHVRGAARIAALAEITGDLVDVTAENERLRASVAGAERVLEAVRSSPAAERGGVQEEMVRWFLHLLEDATQSAGATLAELRSTERHAALLAAADDVGLAGMAKLEFVARISAELGPP